MTTTVLVGKPGSEKTWIARELCDCAIEEKLFDITLWLFLCRNYDFEALDKSIATQLSILSTAGEWDEENYHQEEEKKRERQ